MNYPEKLAAWMVRTNRKTPALADRLGVSTRTVDRWLSGETVPDTKTRNELARLGAPKPDREVEKRPAASKRIEAQLAEVIERLERIENILTRPA